jgi:hypothetical protein
MSGTKLLISHIPARLGQGQLFLYRTSELEEDLKPIFNSVMSFTGTQSNVDNDRNCVCNGRELQF